MQNSATGQVTGSAAEVYEEFYLPALFQQWSGRVAEAAAIQPGQRVLDVACGTGVLARVAMERVGPSGSVTGIDINEGMLAVARRMAPSIDWQPGRAEALPFATDSFDAVVSQFGLMFFEDRHAALWEMLRVVKPGGRLAVAVWTTLNDTPGHAALAQLLDRLFGEQVAESLYAPYSLGDRDQLAKLIAEAGIPDARITTLEGSARFPSLTSWIITDIKGWTLADVLDDTQIDRLLAEAPSALSRFVTADGSVVFRTPAHIVTATKS
jgi:ubiquinone/menaquinone biosynthesis C-methylase UbiE